MSTIPTQNPVPSETAKDLKFNSGKIDEFITSMKSKYIDRFGQEHFTIEGLRWIAQQAISQFGYITLDSFQKGAEITLPNQVLRDEVTGEYYRWDGALPKSVQTGSTPDSSGGVGIGKWISVGDASVRSDLIKPTGASMIGTKEGNLQDALYLAVHGVRLSRYKNNSDPLNSALEASRELKLPLIVDMDCDYSIFVVKAGDKIIGFGDHTLTKKGNDIPSLPKNQHPDRPIGVLSDFNVDAGIVVYHEPNKSAQNILLQGFRLESKHHSRYAIYAPSISVSTIERVSQFNFLTGLRFKNAYLMTVRDFMSLYWYSESDGYTDNICYDFSDGNYTSGTSLILEKVYCTNYKWPFYARNLEYSTWTNCGGEGVNSHNQSTPTNLPRVFEFVNCTNLVLNTPSAEHLYGAFFSAFSSLDSGAQGASTITINNPQAITAIFGTKTNIEESKLFDIRGNVTCIINGGVLVPAADGYFLKFGGAKDESCLILNGMDMRFVHSQIKSDQENYNGTTYVKGIFPVKCHRIGLNNPNSSNTVAEWKTTTVDYYGMASGNRIKTLFSGWYDIEVSVVLTPISNGGMILKIADNDTIDGGDYAVTNVSSGNGKKTVNLRYSGRIDSGKYIYVSIVDCQFTSSWDPDSYIKVSLVE